MNWKAKLIGVNGGPLAWIRRHRFWATLMVIIWCAVAVWAILSGSDKPLLVVVGVGVVWCLAGWICDIRAGRVPVLLLIAALTSADVRAESLPAVAPLVAAEAWSPAGGGLVNGVWLPGLLPEAGILPWVIGGGVFIGGVYVTVKLWRFCSKHFGKPPETNAPPEEQVWGYDAPDGEVYAACWTQGGASCYSGARAASEPIPTLFRVQAWSEDAPEGVVARSRGTVRRPEEIVGPEALAAGLAAWGLTASAFGQSFSRNYQPADPSEVPIRFLADEAGTVAVQENVPGRTWVVERSEDLETWELALTVRIPARKILLFEDVSDSDLAFYRVRLQ